MKIQPTDYLQKILSSELQIAFLICFLTLSPSLLYAQKNSDSLIVIVAEKISVAEFRQEPVKGRVIMDQSFHAKYKVIQRLHGTLEKDTCEFVAYDHYGQPAFSNYQFVLLFLIYNNGKLYHEKYQYFDVYQTVEGRWASCGDPYKFDDAHRGKIKPVALDFTKPVSFDLNTLTKEQVKSLYPTPYYTIKNGQAYCRMGAYVETLFQIKREGVLKARGYF
jgi:hypothetical protein